VGVSTASSRRPRTRTRLLVLSLLVALGALVGSPALAQDAGSFPDLDPARHVYDQTTGLKIFGHVAFYVKTKDGAFAFMRKTDAERFSKSANGKLVGFDDALKLAAAETAVGATVAAQK